jgi:glycolate oxidase FAD binding subunit
VSNDIYAIDGVAPANVLTPTSPVGLSQALNDCSSDGLSVSPLGGRTRIGIGGPPRSYDVALDMTGLDGLVAHDPGDLTTTVQAGITISALQAELVKHEQFLAWDTPLPDRATVGGTLAIGTSGPMRWQGWGVRDLVIGMTVASPDGVLTKSGGQVVKNVSGYDMSRLHIGALGTLGVIAQVSFKLTPLPAGQATVTASFRSAADAFEAGMAVFHGRSSPLALTWLSPVAAQKLAAQNLGLSRKGSHHLAVRLGGRSRTLARMVDEVNAACNAVGPVEVARVDGDRHDSLWRAVADFGWDEATRPAASLRISLPPATAGEVLASLESAAATRGLMPAIVAHLAAGSVLLNLFSPPDIDLEKLEQVVVDTRKLARQRRGTAVLEQAPLEAKQRVGVWDGGGEATAIIRRLKAQFDPDGILNPGRFIDGI